MVVTLRCTFSALASRNLASLARCLCVLSLAPFLGAGSACSSDAPAGSPLATAPSSATPATAPAAPPASKPSSAPKEPEPASPQPAEEASEEALAEARDPSPATKAFPAADRDTRRALVLQHYKQLRCLDDEGASAPQIAQAFADSGLEPAIWNQALGELLDAMAAEPDGEVARAVAAAQRSPCSAGGAR